KPRPPPPPPWGFGRASLILSARPSRSVPFRAAMARSASAESVISTNAKPRERPVSRSVTRLTRSTCPYGSKSERMEDSVAAKSKLPTKMFFISVVCLSIVRARLGRFGPRPGCCRTLKRLFKYSRTLPTGRHGYAELQERSSPLFHRNVPNLLAARPAFRALHFQGYRIVGALGVLVDGVLVRRTAPIAKIPLPRRHLACSLIAEGPPPPVQIEHLEPPVRLELAEFGLQRHEAKGHQFIGLPVHRVLPREIPEGVLLARGVVVIQNRPGQADQFVLAQHGFHGALGALAAGVIEGRDPELERQVAALARFEVVVVGRIGVGQFLHIGVAAPGQRPILAHG